MAGGTSSLGTWLPFSAAATVVVTIFSCYFLATAYLPKEYRHPFVSTLGLLPPARYVYAAGFTLAGILWILSAVTIRKRQLKYVLQDPEQAERGCMTVSFWCIVAAGLGVALQSIVPLQADYADLIVQERLADTNAQSLIHQGFASFFFFGSLISHFTTLRLYMGNSRIQYQLGPAAVISGAVKVSATAIGCVALALLFKLTSPPVSSLPLEQVSRAGLAQWTYIATILIYFASYTLDLRELK